MGGWVSAPSTVCDSTDRQTQKQQSETNVGLPRAAARRTELARRRQQMRSSHGVKRARDLLCARETL